MRGAEDIGKLAILVSHALLLRQTELVHCECDDCHFFKARSQKRDLYDLVLAHGQNSSVMFAIMGSIKNINNSIISKLGIQILSNYSSSD